jgi:uncharacterized protein YdeI (YjbR/CyaY-like superfamily)
VKPVNILYVTDRNDWRVWLAKHHKTETEVWLVYYRKETGKPRISYNDAVEEALCYGWIDSIVRTIDEERFAQRFSMRKKTSSLSQMNKERIRSLITQKKMTKAGLTAIAHIFDPATDKATDFVIPPDILKSLKENKQAWENFQKFPESYNRIRIAFIETRKRHGKEQFQKSLRHYIDMTAKNKRFGFVKEMKLLLHAEKQN